MAMSGGIFWWLHLRKGCCWHLVGGGQGAAQHPTVRGAPCTVQNVLALSTSSSKAENPDVKGFMMIQFT